MQRALSLAAVELECRRCSCSRASTSTSDQDMELRGLSEGLPAAILQHCKSFGHMASCATDLK